MNLTDIQRLLAQHHAQPQPTLAEDVQTCATAILGLPPQDASRAAAAVLSLAQLAVLTGKAELVIPAANHVFDQTTAPADQRMLLSIVSGLSGLTGDHVAALSAGVRACRLARELGDRMGEATCWNNLALPLLTHHDYTRAMACLNQVVAVSAGQTSGPKLARTAQGNMLLLHIWRGTYAEGLSLAQQMFADASWPVASADQINRFREERHYIRLLLEADDERQALARCEVLKARALELNQPLVTLEAWLAEGLTEVQCGRTDAGLSRLDKAVRLARQHPSTLADVLQTVAHAYHRAGLPEDALAYLATLQRQQADEGASGLQAAYARAQQTTGDGHQSAIRVLDNLAVFAELREDASGMHTYRVGALSGWLAERSGMDVQSAAALGAAARWHDLGKMFLPYSLVLRAGKLQRKERELVVAHAQQGANLLQKLSFAQRNLAQTICQTHHERWDGTGYPLGLSSGNIPQPGAVVAIADAFDAMTHARPWRPAYRAAEAVEFVRADAGRAFDPALVEHLCAATQADLEAVNARAEDAAADNEVVQGIRAVDQLLAV